MSVVRRMSPVLAVFGLAMLLGCGDPRAENVKSSVTHVKRLLEDTKSGGFAGLSFAASAEQGGSVMGYLAANMAEPDGMVSYVWMGPPAPYTVVIRPGSAPGDLVIEGYTAKTDKPFTTETFQSVGRP